VLKQEKPIHEVIREARRAKGLTQSELAREAKCTQSAISMYEGGRKDALARETVEAIAKLLGLPPESIPEKSGVALPRVSLVLKYCPIDACPSNVPYAVAGRLIFRPVMVSAPSEERTRCRDCGELLESRCPNAECGAAVGEGSFCARCGTALVTASFTPVESAAAWADKQRARIREIRVLTAQENRT